MTIELIVLTCPPDQSRYSWHPFGSSHEFTKHWWEPGMKMGEPDHHVVATRDGVEVARATLAEGVSGEAYLGRSLGREALEISFFEVGSSRRRQGIGTRIVAALSERFHSRRLVAFSEEADEFWASLGWTRHNHPEGDRYRPLFLAPAPA